MSRLKSPERIQLECDRAIRRERREQKRKVREARRAVREAKRIVRAGLQAHGVPRVHDSGEGFGIRDAIALSPWVWCDAGQRIVREKEMRTADCCDSCFYEWDKTKGGESDLNTRRKEHGDKPCAGALAQPRLPFEARELES